MLVTLDVFWAERVNLQEKYDDPMKGGDTRNLRRRLLGASPKRISLHRLRAVHGSRQRTEVLALTEIGAAGSTAVNCGWADRRTATGTAPPPNRTA